LDRGPYHRLHLAISLLMILGHTQLGALFLAMGKPWLGLVYVGSNAVNVAAIELARRGRWRLGHPT
jgi:hypothetical protein